MTLAPDPHRTRLAVLGSPIAHSLSPTLHGAAYSALDLPFTYGRADVGPGGLAAFVDGLDDTWRGLSLTMPLKREVIPLLTRTTPLVDELGVANTLLFRDEAGVRVLVGANTDVDGIVRPAESLGSIPHGGGATILGGGATAASAMAAALRLGAGRITVFVRDTGRAADLVALALRLGVTLELRTFDELPDVGPLGFVVSTLPGGVADDLRITPSGDDALLFDVAYDPWPSPLATRWADAGGRVLSGLDMLVEQAIGQVRIFAGQEQDEPLPDEAAVRRTMRRAVGLPEVVGA